MQTLQNLLLELDAICCYTVWNRATLEIAGEDYTIDEAFDAIIEFNKNDRYEDWIFFSNQVGVDLSGVLADNPNLGVIKEPVMFKVINGGKHA